jgi:hypothetical protein
MMSPFPSPSVRSAPALRRLVWLVRLLALVGGAALLTVPAVFWTDPGWVQAAAPSMVGLGEHPMVVDERARLLGALASLPGVLLGLVALWRLWLLFGEYAAGRVFGAAAQRHLCGFAAVLLASAIVTPFMRAAVGVALTLSNPPGQRVLAFTLSWNDYLSILCGAVLLAVAWVMADAVRLAEDNEGFV